MAIVFKERPDIGDKVIKEKTYPPHNGTGKKIMSKVLIIDDDHAICKYVSILLQEKIQGCSVLSAYSGEAGIKKAKENLPDAILLDIDLPGINGFEVCSRLKADDATMDIPVIILTGVATCMEEKIKALDTGAEVFISKPFDTSEFIAQVRVVLRIKEITDIRVRQVQLRESEHLLKSVLEFLPDATFVIDAQGIVLFWNKAMEDLSGLKAEDIVGKGDFSYAKPFYGEARPILIDLLRDHNKKYSGKYDHLSWGNDVLSGEVSLISQKGEQLYLSGKAGPIYDSNNKVIGYIESIRDISSRKKTEDELKRSEEKYRSIIESIEEGYYELDLQGNITLFNDCLCSIMGFGRHEMRGMNYREYTDKDDLLKLERIFNRIYRSGEPESGVEWRLVRKDKTSVKVEASITPRRSKGKIIGFQGMVRDVTERKDAEERIKEAQDQLETANLELVTAYAELKATQSKMVQSEKMASIGQLAAGVAHEINNPVGFVTSNLGTLKKYIDKIADYDSFVSGKVATIEHADIQKQMEAERIRSKIDYIMEDMGGLIEESLEGTARVKKIVQDLKSFSRVDEDECKAADINECIESTLNIVWNELKYKVEVHKEYGDVPMTRCYPQQLNQVFMNLLINAGQSIEERGEILIRTWCEDHAVRIRITDTGCGIPQDKLSRIFEPFFTTKEVGKGTGLGLSIVYDIVRKHHGDIDVQSEEGKGTTFDVSIPVIQENGK
ncbi:MAG TPA: PAS domain S-box protein [Deltaproteobacteria bacterium]|nr:PAS domain S-box protein [Deltaproteobacteria bacterium]